MHDFTTLDKALLDSIDAGCNTSAEIKSKKLLKLAATTIGKAFEDHHVDKFARVLDYRLQFLRKAGVIDYKRLPGTKIHGQWVRQIQEVE